MVLPKSDKLGHLARYFGGLIMVLAISFSCQKSDYQPLSQNYYPINSESARIYEVTENYYNVGDGASEIKYLLKEKITQIETEGNSTNFLLQRFKWVNQNWKLDSIWIGKSTPDKILISENNLELLKLLLPATESSSWNINQFNTKASLKATYSNVGEKLIVNKKEFLNTVKVNIKQDSSLINLNKNYEYYAAGVGLIYSEKTNLDYCQSTPDCIGKGIINFGTKKIIKLIDVVKE